MVEQRHLDLIGLGLVCLGVFLAFPLYAGWAAGTVGDAITDALAVGIGTLRFGAPVAVVVVGALVVLRPVLPAVRPFRSGGLCLVLGVALALAAGTLGLGPSDTRDGFWDHDFVRERGGLLGEALFYGASNLVGTIGAHLLALFLLTAAVLLLTGASLATVLQATATTVADTTRSLRRAEREPAPAATTTGTRKAKAAPKVRVPEPEDEDDVVVRPTHVEAPPVDDAEQRFPDLFGDPGREPERPAPVEEEVPAPEPEALVEDDEDDVDPLASVEEEPPAPEPPTAVQEQLPLPRADGDEDTDVEYVVPRPTMLRRSTAEQARPDTRGQEELGARLVEALAHFNVEARIVGTVAGPHITRYELRLAPGIKMSKVAQLKDDLAYALAAVDIRILAPIPGKQAVGVEVPNQQRRVVHLGDVFQDAPDGASPLFVWLGKDVSGKAIGADLAKMPHLLIAGTTGAGKSACVNGLLSSVLLRATPQDARLVLIDPKQVELNHYEEVPHLLTPVITSPRQAANALQNLVREMEWRYGIMSMARTRSLPELNKVRVANDEAPLPYVLCVIDELADLMMVAPADVEDSIIRIAQKARAVGIHLVLATQSPRVDVITGMIKANVPSRIAFSVSSQTDSRVILDQNGAESLLGQGDMLFSPVGSSKLQRIQGAYIDEGQIAQITGFWARQGEPELREDLLEEVEQEDAGDSGRPDDELDPDEDPLLGEAIQLVVEMGTASTSMLQRRLRLGYTRAGRLIDMLERRGVISGYEGSKPRQVLVTEGDLPRVLAALGGDSASATPDAEAPVPELPPDPSRSDGPPPDDA
ncbi:DNA translocase FtsK [Conexibacter sp. SYSU D00693]|uniref:DNA translocase FtsK n=1 Tax=Conexibacter sp. SYSU D00693 TaxID=2812560 RepID=UPI001F11BBFF|nr:DNA translocase FtsK [Conexibacter sp. SYSU D00693]